MSESDQPVDAGLEPGEVASRNRGFRLEGGHLFIQGEKRRAIGGAVKLRGLVRVSAVHFKHQHRHK
ncbi:MAG: hypothetical protein QUV08_08360 [Parasphingorhabdus sp.]|nr:hypothetical protein [Parasphingorhabdus sp.]